jgi:hypothetical protein
VQEGHHQVNQVQHQTVRILFFLQSLLSVAAAAVNQLLFQAQLEVQAALVAVAAEAILAGLERQVKDMLAVMQDQHRVILWAVVVAVLVQ